MPDAANSVFVNWDVIYGAIVTESSSADLYRQAKRGELGNALTSDLCVQKVVTRLVNEGKMSEAANLVIGLLGGTDPPSEKGQGKLVARITTDPVSPGELQDAKLLFLNHYDEIEMDLVDWTTVTFMTKRGIQTIMTRNRNFKKLHQLKDKSIPPIGVIEEANAVDKGKPKVEQGSRKLGLILLVLGVFLLLLIPAFVLFSSLHLVQVTSDVYGPVGAGGAALVVLGAGLLRQRTRSQAKRAP